MRQAAEVTQDVYRRKLIREAQENVQRLEELYKQHDARLGAPKKEIDELTVTVDGLLDVYQKKSAALKSAREQLLKIESDLATQKDALTEKEASFTELTTYLTRLEKISSYLSYHAESDLSGTGYYLPTERFVPNDGGVDTSLESFIKAMAFNASDTPDTYRSQFEASKAARNPSGAKQYATGIFTYYVSDRGKAASSSPRKVWLEAIEARIRTLNEDRDRIQPEVENHKLLKKAAEQLLIERQADVDRLVKEETVSKETYEEQDALLKSKVEAIKEELTAFSKIVLQLNIAQEYLRLMTHLKWLDAFQSLPEEPKYMEMATNFDRLSKSEMVKAEWLQFQKDYERECQADLTKTAEFIRLNKDSIPHELQSEFERLAQAYQHHKEIQQSLTARLSNISQSTEDLSKRCSDLKRRRESFFSDYSSSLNRYLEQRNNAYWFIDLMSQAFGAVLGFLCISYQTEKARREVFVSELKDEIEHYCNTRDKTALVDKINTGKKQYRHRRSNYNLSLKFQLVNIEETLSEIEETESQYQMPAMVSL